jgi:16S rRNA (guanine966-N2)-methyltransferase
LRVIGGSLKGRRLVSPPGKAIRPTADRVKESLFNILAERVAQKRVLDLFAGTGALSIEALSRGALSAVLVDQAKPAIAAIGQNIRNLGLEGRARIIRWNIRKNLNCLVNAEPFDLVFMDPPYEKSAVAPTLTALAATGRLSSGARIVIEHSVRETVADVANLLHLVDQRKFGKTLVSFMDAVL